jgi:hypothetical protein
VYYVREGLLLVLEFLVGGDEVILESDKVVLHLGQLLLQVVDILSHLGKNNEFSHNRFAG